MKDAGVKFHEEIPETDCLKSWFPKGRLMVLDDLMTEGGEDKELLDLFTKRSHHQNITVLNLCQDIFPPGHEECTASSLSHLPARYDGCVSKSDRTTVRVYGSGFTFRQ